MAEKKTIKQSTDCKNNKHCFVVTKWLTQSQKQKAIEMRCRYCLLPMNLEEIESLEWQREEGML